MIILTDVAAKLSEILNSADCPSSFHFVVKSQGYHLDSIADHKTGENKIPVFLTIVGGEYNPVPNLHETNFTYGVSIWFPVRFKEDFYALNEYLEETFVGKKVEIGDKVALCNISVAEYGEITGLHLDQFEQWLEDTYEGNVHIFKKEHDISEEYMSMEFRLFCTTLGDGFMFGNDVKHELQVDFKELNAKTIMFKYTLGSTIRYYKAERYPTGDTIDGTYTYYCWRYEFAPQSYASHFTRTIKETEMSPDMKIYYSYQGQFIVDSSLKFEYFVDFEESGSTISKNATIVWDSAGTGASISPISEQLVGEDRYARNTPNITNFNKSIVVYPKIETNNLWNMFIRYYNYQRLNELSDIKLVKTYTINGQIMNFVYNQIILSYNENIALGEPLSFTLTFGD